MLLQFSVENFRSIKDEAVLSLVASTDKENQQNCINIGNNKILKSIAIYGANASGKSNIFHALTAAILTIRESASRQIGEPLHTIVPFKFDDAMIRKPTKFEFVFITGDIKYAYGFSATHEKIIDEFLDIYNSAKPTTVFKRRDTTNYKFTYLKKTLEPLVERNTDNKLFLSTATAWNCVETKAPYLWFESGINTRSTDRLHIDPMFENDEDGSLRRFTNNLLHEADISINDYEFESRELSKNKIPPALREFLSNPKEYRVDTFHNIEDADGNMRTYNLSLPEESAGTEKLFMFSPLFKKAFETGETVCIDEFGANFHPMLAGYIIGLFHNPNVNKGNAQLIVSGHTMDLLDLDIMRRDQIYFMEKDRKSGASNLYSLDEYSPRLHEDVRKSYLLGRFGAVPNIGYGDDLWR